MYHVYFLNENLDIAAGNGDLRAVRSLLNRGGSANAEGVDGIGTALIDASAAGHIQIVQLLIERGADVNLANSHGETALHAAKTAGHNDIARILLKAGAKSQIR